MPLECNRALPGVVYVMEDMRRHTRSVLRLGGAVQGRRGVSGQKLPIFRRLCGQGLLQR